LENREIYITEFDLERLNNLIINSYNTNKDLKPYLDNLISELKRAHIVLPKEIPPDVVTMNSRVCILDMENDEESEYTLVFPDNADLVNNKISVLAPIGTAILGYRVGDIIQWNVPDGIRKLKMVRISFQPEASGNFDL